jgi:hypothetical protein
MTTLAAPISGSLQVDLVIHSFTCGVDEDADTFIDEDLPNGIDDDADTLVDEDHCFKVDDTLVKFEADLLLQMAVSGLEVSSITVFTFKGIEYQALTLAATIGALSVRDTFVFAPGIVEMEIVRTNLTLAVRYCINASAPGDLTPPFLTCPLSDSMLYWLLEDVGRFHPAVANYTLAQIFDHAGMLDEALVFRKKIVELSLNIAGLTLSSRALFANLGAASTPNFVMGVIAALEGQTLSGVIVRAESWIGARQGLECFGECKPIERLYLGKVISSENFTIQEEKIFIRNLRLAGIVLNIRAEFQFFSQPNSSCLHPGICYIQIDSRWQLQPLNLFIKNELRLGPELDPRFDIFETMLKFGDISVTAILYAYLASHHWGVSVMRLISSFDPPGLTLVSDLTLCTESFLIASCGFSNAALQHNIYVSGRVGNFVMTTRLILLGFITPFFQLWVDLVRTAGLLELTSSAVFSTDAVEALAFGIKVRF